MKKNSDGTQDHELSVEEVPSISRRMVAGGFVAIATSLAGSSIGRAATKGNGQAYKPQSGTDYAMSDSPYFDPDFPPIHFPHVFTSQGKTIQSFMWIASGNEPKGCVILSSQVFGGDALDSLVPALIGAGINVMRFHARGMWDDDQDFTFTGALDDLHAAVAFLRQNGGQHTVPPGTGPNRPFQIDVDRIAVLGKSGGGGMLGWVAAAENPNLNTVVTVAPGMMVRPPLSPERVKGFADLKKSTAGRVDLMKWVTMPQADYDRLSMLKASPKLVNKNVLLVGASEQHYLQDTHKPLVQSMKSAGAKHFSEVVLEGNSYFLTVRNALARLVVTWLKTECGF